MFQKRNIKKLVKNVSLCVYASKDNIIIKSKIKRCIKKILNFEVSGIRNHKYANNINGFTKSFYSKIKEIKEKINMDVEAVMKNDPASNSVHEVVSCYPGILALLVYRIAHVFYENGYKVSARHLSEFAHSKTGIDIHPGAKIGDRTFIDHGTGIVIGETTEIGNDFKIYHGVTLGAFNLSDARKLKEVKRHPTIKNNVTIYSNAVVLGGDTVIGNNVIIGANASVIESIEDNKIVVTERQKLLIKSNKYYE